MYILVRSIYMYMLVRYTCIHKVSICMYRLVSIHVYAGKVSIYMYMLVRSV